MGLGPQKGESLEKGKTSRDLFYTVIPFASWCLTPLFKTFYVNFTQTKTTKLKLPSRETQCNFCFLVQAIVFLQVGVVSTFSETEGVL